MQYAYRFTITGHPGDDPEAVKPLFEALVPASNRDMQATAANQAIDAYMPTAMASCEDLLDVVTLRARLSSELLVPLSGHAPEDGSVVWEDTDVGHEGYVVSGRLVCEEVSAS